MPRFKIEPERRSTRSTAIVLWLMILVVFVPIAAVHGLARALSDGGTTEATLR